ncbi:hypothetical protein SAMN05444004_11416 [Jannaschia faecimaris]|uniref:Uncharacterized protein n=1 Tax=Jannaschia faecimaris TaxID=1244108 RepID=A0A1H3SXE6_9RHOB|nr:hypothetical protein [Jannaschia faecimaris]SDZ42308.1 hypothetical protein SAMN05444004_11416 [Jannaschia faecimaris]
MLLPRSQRAIAMVAASLLLSMPQTAFAGLAPAACLVPTNSIDTAVDALTIEGWRVLPDGPLPEVVGDQLVWLYVAYYMTGDTGGETLSSILELQRRTVEGLARKRDITGSKTRLMTSDAGAMIVFWREPDQDHIEYQCRLALNGPDAPGNTLFAVNEEERIADGYVQITALDRAALAEETGRDVVTAQLVETHLTYSKGATE